MCRKIRRPDRSIETKKLYKDVMIKCVEKYEDRTDLLRKHGIEIRKGIVYTTILSSFKTMEHENRQRQKKTKIVTKICLSRFCRSMSTCYTNMLTTHSRSSRSHSSRSHSSHTHTHFQQTQRKNIMEYISVSKCV